MRKFAAFLVFLALAACGGGGAQSAASLPSVLFQERPSPAIVNDPGGTWDFPRDVGFVATFAAGTPLITSDARGVGITVASWQAPVGSDPIKAANYSWMPSGDIRPFVNGGQACTSYSAAVPASVIQGALATYAGSDIWLSDHSTGKPTGGKTLIVSGMFFDARGMRDGPPGDYVAQLNAVQFGGPIGYSRYFTTTAGTFHTATWSDPAPFGFCVTREQAAAMAAAAAPILHGVMDPDDMVIGQALLSNEIALAGPSSQDPAAPGALLTTYFSNWTITVK